MNKAVCFSDDPGSWRMEKMNRRRRWILSKGKRGQVCKRYEWVHQEVAKFIS